MVLAILAAVCWVSGDNTDCWTDVTRSVYSTYNI